MESLRTSIAVNVASSFIYEAINSIFKFFSGHTIESYKLKKEINEYINEHFPDDFVSLTTSDKIELYLNSPQVYDIIKDYYLARSINKCFSIGKESTISLGKILSGFTNDIIALYACDTDVVTPEYELVFSYLEFIIECIETVLYLNLNIEDKKLIYFINSFTDATIDGLTELVKNTEQNINDLLKKVVKYDPDFTAIKKEYYDILKKKNSEAHIYLLDKFPFKDFYVPPRLISSSEKHQYLKMITHYHGDRVVMQKKEDISWEYIFLKQNIIYITGGAGYGKSLFLKKIINDYDKLGIYKSHEYLVIYGELKNFYPGKAQSPIPVIDFLLNSARMVTLLDETKISKEFLNHYLNMGRCIILLDALDEVDKSKRNDLHESLIAYFKSQNPNNKVCITSRDRGFIPEKDIEIFNIGPLDKKQIELYVDKIIELKKFEKSEKESFLEQANVLVKKGFLNSFLALSLLINIYKAEKELPENKLELYQKCFDYISNKREKDKSMGNFDWKMISPLMKDNTFIELAVGCYPNNVSADTEQIKKTLLEIYTSKYGSEAETENAIEEFLKFCSDRTELFVPAAEENKFKFFHRSFFEYFYSQYIFLNFESSKDILNEFRKFDVDSEVFELTVAMLKQKSEKRYQELIELMIKEAEKEFEENNSFSTFNVLVLAMQAVDDVLYKKRFVSFLVDNKDTILNDSQQFHNLHLLPNIFRNDASLSEIICSAYDQSASQKLISAFFNVCRTLDSISKSKIPELLDSVFSKNESEHLKLNFEGLPFYINFFITAGKLELLLSQINNYQINVLLNQNNKKTKKYVKYLNMYRSFTENQKKAFLALLVNLSKWDLKDMS